MNIKDFTFELVYNAGKKDAVVSVDGESLLKGYSDDNISLSMFADDAHVVVTLHSNGINLKSAKLIYDRYFENGDKFFSNGFQSWTTSREYGKGDVQNGLSAICKLPIARDYAGASGDYHFTKYAKNLYHGFTYCYIRNEKHLELFGSLNERTGYTVFYADYAENLLQVVKDVEGVKTDGDYELFNVVYFSGKYDEVFDRYFEAYPRKFPKRVERLTGYTSWYNYYQGIDEKIILRDLEGLKRAEESANIFQIDDGYETMVGDWELDENKFKGGMVRIVDKIHVQNLKAGIWVAPYAAQFKSEVVKKHPEWLIKKPNGKPVISGVAWGGFYALDYELPEVREYVKDVFDKIFDDWGFDMVKLDFLYCSAIYPRNGKSRGQLMCESLDYLRECCGEKLILGCGVPLGPAFGVVDACRIGCDAENSFKDKYYVGITNQEVISTRNAMNNAIFRRHLNGRIFLNDPDVFFLRNGGVKVAKYSMQQKKLLATVNNMFGSVLFVSDNVGEYDDEQLAILLDSYKPFGGEIELAEYKNADTIRIKYKINGERHYLQYDVYTGNYKHI